MHDINYVFKTVHLQNKFCVEIKPVPNDAVAAFETLFTQESLRFIAELAEEFDEDIRHVSCFDVFFSC